MSCKLYVAVAGAALCALPSFALAGQKISFDGTHYYSAQFHTVQFEKGHAYSMLREWRGINHATDPSSITHLTRLECHGYIDARADGTFAAEGYCNHWDRDGDLWVGHWWNNSTMPVGRYELIAGEGKYAGATGGGTANCKLVKPPPEAQAVCEVTGAIDLK